MSEIVQGIVKGLEILLKKKVTVVDGPIMMLMILQTESLARAKLDTVYNKS